MSDLVLSWLYGHDDAEPPIEALTEPSAFEGATRLLDALDDEDALDRLEALLLEALDVGDANSLVAAAFAGHPGPRAVALLQPHVAAAPAAGDPLEALARWLVGLDPAPDWTDDDSWVAAARALDGLDALSMALAADETVASELDDAFVGRLEALLLTRPLSQRQALLDAGLGPRGRTLLSASVVAPVAEPVAPVKAAELPRETAAAAVAPGEVEPLAEMSLGPRPTPWRYAVVAALAAAALLFVWLGGPSDAPRPEEFPVPPAPPIAAPSEPPTPFVPEDDRALAATKMRPALLRIEAGRFRMGSPAGELGRNPDETLHAVTLTTPFWLGRTEVTQAQWAALMGNDPSRDAGHPTHPVERVSWYDAAAYLNALSARDGLPACYVLERCTGTAGAEPALRCEEVTFRGLDCPGYRLPTEAEWEYAARAGTDTAVWTGDVTFATPRNASALDDLAWYSGNSGRDDGALACAEPEQMQHRARSCGAHPVATKAGNPWGLHDMLGNVWEWTNDRYGAMDGAAQTDPTGPETGPRRVTRGGGWFREARFCRAANRYRPRPDYRVWTVGFRPARTVSRR